MGKLTLSVKNRNKGSHNTGNRMLQAFNNWRSESVKGSHNRWYVTVLEPSASGYSEKLKFKARRHSQRQSVNGGLAGDKNSNLPELITESA